ncbi:MAG: hypothetical protein H0W06_00435 [Chloroflexia bacterium]|nr:hypothetical protein [Chloroflexia bacterium]
MAGSIGAATEPRENQCALDALYVKLFGTDSAPSASSAPRTASTLHLSDEAIIRRAEAATNGAKFAALYSGDTGDYDGDESRADQALCSMLSFWTQDPAQIERIFSCSALGQREKWQRRADYRQRTISKALERTEVYAARSTTNPNGQTPNGQYDHQTNDADDTDASDDAPQPRSGDEQGEGEDRAPRRSQATILVELAEETTAEFFHTPQGEMYATIPVGTHRETLLLRGKAFRLWLMSRYWERFTATPNTQALQDAIGRLSGKALFEGLERQVWVRLAVHDDRLYLDLGDAEWQVVEIQRGRWKTITAAAAPVRFRRPRTLLPLPIPDPEGSLDDLDALLSITDANDLLRVKGWVIGVFQMEGGRAILEFNGEQGSAKTTTARLFRRIMDPSTADLRAAPRDERDLMIAAANGLIVGVDNLSDMKDWLSDALCRLSTGGGIGGRELYSDLEEITLDAQRPCLLTAINPANSKGDRLSRTISVTLPVIKPQDRRTEAELWSAFAKAHPRLLGGVLNAVATALERRHEVSLPRKPRLADIVEWVEAASPALGWESGVFAATFEAGQCISDALAVESLPIGPAVMALMENNSDWKGTATELLDKLSPLVGDRVTRDPDWPKRANRLSNQLNRLAPNLRTLGIEVTFDRGGSRGTRTITLSKNQDVWDRQHRQSPSDDDDLPPNQAFEEVPTDGQSSEDRQAEPDSSSVEPHQHGASDDADDADDQLQAHSATVLVESDGAKWEEGEIE